MATKFLVSLVMIAGISAVPLNVKSDLDKYVYQCAQQKCKDLPVIYGIQNSTVPTKFFYKPHHTYLYEYRAEAETSMAGASEEKAKMQIETYASIEVINICEFALRLQKAEIYHSEPSSDSLKPSQKAEKFRRELTANTLRFSFHDGIIRDICPSPQEKTWVLNFKRGLLSAFQNSMDDLSKSQKVQEVDVTGECETQYNMTKESSRERSFAVTKSKNLLACSKHNRWRTLVRMVPYQVQSDIQSLPIMKSSHRCDAVISSSVMIYVSCKESHIFAPFSNHQSGGATNVWQTLSLIVVKSGIETSQDYIESRSSLLFHHINGIDEIQNSQEAAEQKLKEICEQTKRNVRPETPRLFSELIQIVKVLEKSDLRRLYKKTKNSQNNKAMKFLLDTLPIAGTSGALELMATIVNDEDISDMDKQVWLTSLSLIPEPSEDMLPSLLKLLSGKSGDQALLPVSALLHTICEKSVDCDRSYQFRKIVKKIDSSINSCNSDERTQVVKTLRAIGNIGYGKDFLDSLKDCLNSQNAPLEYKVAAAEAYRRFPCQQDEENGRLFQAFEAQNADPELRIISYLSLMRCPRDSVLEKIAAQLEKEDDINVGTFVYSHLENLKKTSDPHRQDIAQAVKRFDLRKFEDSGLKPSRHFAHSTLVNRLNLGYAADADLIWSQSSVVPREVKVNLTLALFGQSVNVFEGGIRIDGLERFVQKYFGTEGYFPKDEASRGDFQAFMYARVFGNELFFKHVKGSKDLEDMKSHFNLDKIIENLSRKFDFKHSHNYQLIDQSLIIPTAIGLPVNIAVNSSVTMDIAVIGNMDFNGIMFSSKPISVLTDAAASAALEVTGSMLVDAHVYKQGLRMRNTLHSNVKFKSSMTIKKKQILNFDIESPQERQELFDARSQFFIIHNNFENEQDMIKDNRKEFNYCTGDKLAKITGVELCGEVQYPNASMKDDVPHFPLTGPARMSLVLNKKDTQRSYKIFTKWIRNTKKLEVQFQLDTPGSKVNRHILADVTIGIHKVKHVDVVLISPWKKFLLNGKAAKNSDMAVLTGNVVIDDTDKYKLTSEVKLSKQGKRHQYLPFVEIENHGDRTTLLAGSVIYNENKNISVDLQMKDLNKKSYTHSSQLILHKQEKRLVFSIGEEEKQPFQIRFGSTIRQSGKKSQSIKLDPELLIQSPRGVIASLQSNMEFQSRPLKVIGNVELKTIRMKRPFTLKVGVKQKRHSYPVFVKLSSQILTGDVKGKVDLRKNSYSSTMKINYRTNSIRDLISWTGKLLDRSKNTYAQYNLNSILKFKSMPDYNTASTLILSHKKKSSAQLTINYGKKSDKKVIQVTASVSANLKNVKQAKIKANLKAKMLEKNVDIKLELDHMHNPKKIGSEIKIHLAPFLQNDINAAVNIQNKGKFLYLITGNGRLEIDSKRYDLQSDLTQKTKSRFQHTLIVSSSEDVKHKLVSHYKNGNNIHEIVTDIESTHLKTPLKLSMSANVKSPSDFSVTGGLSENEKELYSIDYLSKFEEGIAGKWNLELVHPLRKIKANANFNKVKDRIKTEAFVNWDVDSKKEPIPQIQVTSYFTHVSQPDLLLMKFNVKIETPFKNWHKLTSVMNFEKSNSELKSTGRLAWGGMNKQISSQLSAKLPISIEDTKIYFQAKTPFKNYKDIELEVDHVLGPEITTILKGKMANRELNVKGKIKNNKDIYKTTLFQGDLILKTPHSLARRTVVSAMVTDDSKGLTTFIDVDKNGKKYSADFNSNSLLLNGELSKVYKLAFVGPGQTTAAVLGFRTMKGKHSIDLKVDSLQDRDRGTSVAVTGVYHDVNNMYLDVDVKSPFNSWRKVGLEVEHKVEEEELKSKIIMVTNHGQIGYAVMLSNRQSEMSADILLLLSPAYEKDVSLVSKIQYEFYPVMASTQISWAPSSVIDLSGSYKAESADDMQTSFKLTTPFKDLEDINVVVSHALENSVRVSHLNIDYDVRKMVDIEIQSQNDELKKIARIKIDTPCSYFQHLDTGVRIDLKRGFMSRVDLELELRPKEKYDGFVSLNVGDNGIVKGNTKIRTPIEGLKKIDGRFVKYNPNSNKMTSLKLSKDDEDLVIVVIDNTWKKDKFTIEVTTKGKILETLTGKYDQLDQYDPPQNVFGIMSFEIVRRLHDVGFLPKRIKKDRNGNLMTQIITQFNMEQEDERKQVGGSLTLDYGRSQNRQAFSIQKIGETMNYMDIDISLTSNRDTLTGKLVLHLIDDIKIQALLNDIFGYQHGVEFFHLEKSGKFEAGGTLYLGELRGFQSSFYFLMSDINHMELTTTTKSDIRGYELTSVMYRHEFQENGINCSFHVGDINGQVGSIDLVAESNPVHLFFIIVKTPYRSYEEMIISGNYNETNINGLVKITEDKKIFLSGVRDNFKNARLTLKTPFQPLQMLSVSVVGDLSNGSTRFTLHFNDYNQIHGNVVVKYENLSQMSFSTVLNSRVDKSENSIKLEVDSSDKPRKTSHFLLALNDKDQIKFDTQWESEQRKDAKIQLGLELQYPSLDIQTKSLILNLDGNKEKASGKIQLLSDSGKVLDADINVNMESETKTSVVVHHPKLMKYRFTQKKFPESKENQLYFNWDRTNPDASLVIQSTVKDDSNYYKTDKTISLRLSFPRRSIGVEYSLVATRVKVQSNGKVYWNDGRESQVSYDLQVNDQSNMRKSFYDGELTLQLPTRTIGLYGSTRVRMNERQVESTISWDLDNDSSKKIGIKTKLLKGDHTQADISLILPQDAHVDSKLVLSQGNTILEGQTQIFYSDDSSKTLTFFSKVESSIQVGLSHPDSGIDVKVDSHLGIDHERLTTSVGLDYLNSHAQTNNVALIVEINKLKREINLIVHLSGRQAVIPLLSNLLRASEYFKQSALVGESLLVPLGDPREQSVSPYSNIGISSAIISKDPFEVKTTTTADDETKMSAHLLIDPNNKKFNISWTNFGRGLSLSAHYPNKTALQLDLKRVENGESQQYTKTVFQLSTPVTLQTSLHWKPGMVVEIRDMFFQNLKQGTFEFKKRIKNIAQDTRREVTRKYEDVTTSVYEDVKQLVEFMEQECVSIEKNPEKLHSNLNSNFDFCDVKIGDFDLKLKEEFAKLQNKIKSFVKGIEEVIGSYTKSYRDALLSIVNKLEAMKSKPAHQVYYDISYEIGRLEVELFNTHIWHFSEAIHGISLEELEAWWNFVDRHVERYMDPQPVIKEMNEGMKVILNTRVSAHILNTLINKRLASKIKTILSEVKEIVVNNPLTKKITQVLEDSGNQVYQQAKWACWEVETSLLKHFDELVNLTVEVAEEELKEQMGSMYRFIRNPLRQFDPDLGVLVAEFPLPVSIDRLDQIPDVGQLSDQLLEFVENQLGASSLPIHWTLWINSLM